jgi:hypothetical protein
MPAAAPKSSNLVERLKKNLSGYYSAGGTKDRVQNPSIPFNALEIQDWPSDLDYDWVPAPGGLAPSVHNMSEMANLRASYIQKGWQFYPSEDFRSEPDTGFPWLSVWEDDNGKVRAMDHWLVYADRDMEARKRAENLRRWNERREGKRQSALDMDDSNKTRDIVESQKGRTTVAELLKEGDSDK